MFNSEFFPTPEQVIEKMLYGHDFNNKVVLEPSAGSGAILDVLRIRGAKTLACELNKELQIITIEKSDEFLTPNFFDLTPEKISHLDYIVMNPPFSNADKHILHAHEIAPNGCTIIALCNSETIRNPYSKERKRLSSIIQEKGIHEFLGDCFSNADRRTTTDITMIKIFKPKSESENEFDDFLFSEEEQEEFYGVSNGLVKYSYIRDMVGRYIQSVQMFDAFLGSANKINSVMRPLGADFKLSFSTIKQQGNVYSTTTRDQFKKELQKSAWLRVFAHMKMGKYLTSRVMEQLNKKIESQINLPFSEKNIYGIIQMIVGTHEGRMKETLVEIFDWLTERHAENRSNVEGWKTNSMYFVGEKFIAPYCGIGYNYSGYPEIRWSSTGEKLDEMVKALCLVTGNNYDNFESLHDFFRGIEVPNNDHTETVKELSIFLNIEESKADILHNYCKWVDKDSKITRLNDVKFRLNLSDELTEKLFNFYQTRNLPEKYWGKRMQYKEWGKWMDWGFFEIRVYKKGTLHAKFKDKKVWEIFNRECAKAKGWRLPTNTGSDVRRKTAGVEIFEPKLF